jgi:transcriptional regulator with XRE-family HTH domain
MKLDEKIFLNATLYESLTEYFRDVRTLKGLGLPTIAESTGFHTSNLSRIERSVHRPTPDTLDRLAAPDAYGCPWWSAADNALFLRALAYHLTQAPSYAPRQAEWWPTDVTTAVSGAGVIVRGTTWAHSVRWPALMEIWPALGLPGWQPPTSLQESSPPAVTRPMWLWGTWTVTLDLKSDDNGMAAWYQNIAGRDDTDLATVVLGALLESVERWRRGRPTGAVTQTLPTDSDFHAIAAAWPGLRTAHRRLVRELVESLSQK